MIPDGSFPAPEGEPPAGRDDRPERAARLPRPADDNHAGQRQWPDPLYAVRGEAR